MIMLKVYAPRKRTKIMWVFLELQAPPATKRKSKLWTARWKISKLGNGSMWRPGQNWTDIEIKTFPGAKTFRYENSMRLTIWWPPACWTTFQEALQPEECLLFSGDPLVQSSGTSYQRNEHVTCNTFCLFLPQHERRTHRIARPFLLADSWRAHAPKPMTKHDQNMHVFLTATSAVRTMLPVMSIQLWCIGALDWAVV